MKKITAFFIAFCIFLSSNFIAPKSHAVVGLIAKSKAVKVIGGIGAGAGAATFATSGIVIASTASVETAVIAVLYAYLGVVLGGIGLIILDDKTVADVEFTSLSKETAPHLSASTIAVYNSELDELNAIRKTIQAETSGKSKGFKEAQALWLQYRMNLSDETVAAAEGQAKMFMESIRPAK